MKIDPSKFDKIILRPVSMLYESFKFVSVNKFGKWAVKSFMVGPGLVGPGRFITDMGSIHENKLFCSLDYVAKMNTKRDMRCCELPYVITEGGSRLRATLAMMRSTEINDTYVPNWTGEEKLYRSLDRPHSWQQTLNPQRSQREEWRDWGFRGFHIYFQKTPFSTFPLYIRGKYRKFSGIKTY